MQILFFTRSLLFLLNGKRSKYQGCLTWFIVLSLFTLSHTACRKDLDTIQSVQQSTGTNSAVSVAVRPNIVFILGDDIGVDVPTCYGGQSYETPNIDKLAKKGMRFTRCYSSPLCSPSR